MADNEMLKSILAGLANLSESLAAFKGGLRASDNTATPPTDPDKGKEKPKWNHQQADTQENKLVGLPEVKDAKDTTHDVKPRNTELEYQKPTHNPEHSEGSGPGKVHTEDKPEHIRKETETKDSSANEDAKASAPGKVSPDKEAETLRKESETKDSSADAAVYASEGPEAEEQKMRKEIASLKKKLEDTEASLELVKVDAAKKLVEKDEEKKKEVDKAKADTLVNTWRFTPGGSDVFDLLDLSQEEATVAKEIAPVDLLKEYLGLKREINSLRSAASEQERGKLAEVRFQELSTAGLAFTETKASEQKEKIANMTEEAFASYKADLSELATSIASVDPKLVIQKAKEEAGSKSTVVKDNKPENKLDKYSLLMC